MSQRRILVLVAAIAMGAVASFLVWNYVGGVQDKADQSTQQVPVYLVKTAIARGTTGLEATQSGAIGASQVPRKFLPLNALTSLDGISEQVSLGALVPNQVVVSDMFVDASVGAESFAERLKKIAGTDQVAVTISIDQTRGVAGLLKPGDFVNIMSVVPPTGDEKALLNDVRMVLEKVQILAIGQTPALSPGEAPPGAAAPDGGTTTTTAPAAVAQDTGLVTMIVPATSAQFIAAMPPGNIYLTLVAKDYKPVPIIPINPTTPFPGEVGTQLTPYGPAGRTDLG